MKNKREEKNEQCGIFMLKTKEVIIMWKMDAISISLVIGEYYFHEEKICQALLLLEMMIRERSWEKA